MKICRLDLIAYGPFDGISLDFSAGGDGLHIIYGDNEAGKSAALRALTHLFYGIPVRTPDAFAHKPTDLKIGGTLRHSSGREIQIIRRKGRKNTLLDPSGQPLAELSLNRYLDNVGKELFGTLFGMNQDMLVEGGRALAAGRGDIGESLFAAGSGILGMREVIHSLETEAGELFKRKARKSKINRLATEIKKLRKVQAEKALSATEWSAHDQALTRSQAKRNQCLEEIKSLKSHSVEKDR